VIEQLLWLLEDLQLTYAVGGSMAGTFHGEPRTTNDIDVLVALDQQGAQRLIEVLSDDYYVPHQAIKDAVRTHSSFNLVHIPSSFKVDLFVAGHSSLDQEQLARRIRVRLRRNAPHSVWLTSPEVLIVRKLLWRRSAQNASQRQWLDVVSILRTQDGRLDEALMNSLAADLDLGQALDEAREAARSP
jgi:hypothetical protein